MGVYVHFTDEQKFRANNVDLVSFLETRGETLIKSGRENRLASDHSITVRGNEWYDHSREQGGYAIDFVKQFYGISFPEAMTMLLGGEHSEIYSPAPAKKDEPKKPFALPNPHSDMRRAYAYLVKTRLNDREVVRSFSKANLLYESCEKSKDGVKEYHNAVFVGVDETGTAKHAHKRGLYTEGAGFKGNVDGCNPRYSFHWIGESDNLYVFEAPVDMLSFITLNPNDWQRHSYVSLCGVGGQAMLWMLEQYPQLRQVSLCLDNDEAGHKACDRMKNQLIEKGYLSERLTPQGKDWNDDLVATAQQNQGGFKMKMA